jgi:hypothetical protein
MANRYNPRGLLSPLQSLGIGGGVDPLSNIDPLRGQSLMGQPMRMPAASPMALQLQQRVQPQQARGGGVLGGLGRAFTGEGSSARLSALGASLLQGPSRTPISLGSSLAQGLLAGNVAAQQEEERRFKRGLLERQARQETEAETRAAAKEEREVSKVEFGKEKDLRSEFDNLSKNYRQSAIGYERVLAAGTATDPSGADDIALIFGFMKTIDPTSVVRESEFDLAQDTGGAPAQAKAFIQRVIDGQRLTPEMRSYFVNAASNQFASLQRTQSELEDRYRTLSSNYDVDPKKVVNGLSQRYLGTERIPAPVSNTQQAALLPKNTYFILPDGRKGINE